jgi:hypothetical protein
MTSKEKNLKLKLPEKLYCGFQQRSDDELLGFLTPFGTDAAFEKRKYTVDHWASRIYRDQKNVDSKIFDNVLLDGYRLDRHIKRYGWNGGNVVVRIEDPRGFEVEISVANLCKLIENNTIENGIIKAKCIWGREGSQNILLAENSQPYLDAIENTRRYENSVSLKDIQPGYKILLKNGVSGIYLGRARTFSIVVDMENGGECLIPYINKKNPKHFVLGDSELFSYTELRVSEIISDKTVYSEEERRKQFERYLSDNSFSSDYNTNGFIFSNNQKIHLKVIPLEYNTIEELKQKYNPKRSFYIAKEKSTGSMGLLRAFELKQILYDSFYLRGHAYDMKMPEIREIEDDKISFFGKVEDIRHRNWAGVYSFLGRQFVPKQITATIVSPPNTFIKQFEILEISHELVERTSK